MICCNTDSHRLSSSHTPNSDRGGIYVHHFQCQPRQPLQRRHTPRLSHDRRPRRRRRRLDAGRPASAAGPGVRRRRRRKSVIMVYLFGGPSHLDMYDLKPDAPAEYRGEFGPIRDQRARHGHLRADAAAGAHRRQVRHRPQHGLHAAGPRRAFARLHLRRRPRRRQDRDASRLRLDPQQAVERRPESRSRAAICRPTWRSTTTTSTPPGSARAHRPFVPTPLRALPLLNDNHPDIVNPVDLRNLGLRQGLTLERVQDRTALLRSFDTHAPRRRQRPGQPGGGRCLPAPGPWR